MSQIQRMDRMKEPLKGKINIDDISFIYKGQLPALPKNAIKLTVNKKQATLE